MNADPLFAPSDLEQIIDRYLEDYVMEGDDGAHTPTEGERLLIKDAIQGLLVDPEWDAAWGRLIDEQVERAKAADQ